jgi:signal transduction histidine kinase/ligand-binding sensor domain-containing protein
LALGAARCLQTPVLAQAPPTDSASDFLLHVWQRNDGLPHNTVSAIAQTRDGYLWVGTHDGLVRFDGAKFTPFPPRQFPGLEASHIDCLSAGTDGSLWIGLERGGVSRWQTDRFETMTALSAYTNRINTLAPHDSEVWVGLSQGRVTKWSNGAWTTFAPGPAFPAQGRVFCRVDPEGRTWFASDTSFGYFAAGTCVPLVTNKLEYFRIAPRAKGGIWLAHGHQLERFEPNLGPATVASLAPLGDSGGIEAFYEDRKGALWLGTRGSGLYRFADGRLTRVPTSHDFILAVCEDSEGDIWVGTWGGGLNRLKPRLLRVYGKDKGLPRSLLLSLCEDDQSRLWIAARNAPPVSLEPSRAGVMVQTNGWNAGPAGVLCPDRRGGLWLGTEQRGLHHWQAGAYRAEPFPRRFIMSLFQDSQTNLWIGTLREGLFLWPLGQDVQLVGGDELREITAITEDPGGTIWVGTQKGTLHRRDKGDRSFKPLGVNEGLPGQKIQVIHADAADRLWIGTRGGGLVRLKNNRAKAITTARGIPDDDIRQILADEAGGLWFGCGGGLFRAWGGDLDLALNDEKFAVECVSFGASYGLANFEFQEGFRNAMCRTRAGRLWFATTRGAVEVDPARYDSHDEPPPVYIEDITVDGRPMPLRAGTSVEIPPASGRVEIRYTATSFSAPENVRFRHRLESFDTDWVEAGHERAVSYFRLPPGQYRFRVIARGSTGIWNQVGDNILLAVRPTLWETLWFRMLVFALLVLVLGAVVRITLMRRMRLRLRELERANALENERRRIARDMHDELGASLTTLALMSEQMRRHPSLDAAATAKADRISATAAEVAHTLDQIVWTVNPGNDTLERLIGYLSHYATEFLSPTPIRLTQELPQLSADHRINSDVRHQLFLTFKEALNNAVKHAAATEIKLRIWLQHDVLHIAIEDNGKGFTVKDAEGKGEGLVTLRERLLPLGGRCHVESEPGKGTRVTLTLPLDPAGD